MIDDITWADVWCIRVTFRYASSKGSDMSTRCRGGSNTHTRYISTIQRYTLPRIVTHKAIRSAILICTDLATDFSIVPTPHRKYNWIIGKWTTALPPTGSPGIIGIAYPASRADSCGISHESRQHAFTSFPWLTRLTISCRTTAWSSSLSEI